MTQSWKKITCHETDLQLDPILTGGQSFRWKKSEDGIWKGIFKNRLWFLKQTDDSLLYQCYQSEKEPSESTSKKRKKETKNDCINDEALLRDYFRLDVDLEKLYNLWSQTDPYFKKSAATFYGIRILNQDLIENLFSFICSSNNNITRISSMVEKLCKFYGSFITTMDGISYYSFPEVDRLCLPSVETELRRAGFGYRGKFIQQSACKIVSLGYDKWIEELKAMPYIEAKNELMKLPGVGPKVADCICLMSLSHLEAIPVDTHIFQVASKIYLPHLKGYKSVTNKVYNEISTHFQNLYGDKAGWAHTILFCSELKAFKGKKKSFIAGAEED